MTSLVTGLGKRQLNLSQPWKDRKIVLLVGPELKFENNESAQHRFQFPEIRKGAKISFHRHLKTSTCPTFIINITFVVNNFDFNCRRLCG